MELAISQICVNPVMFVRKCVKPTFLCLSLFVISLVTGRCFCYFFVEVYGETGDRMAESRKRQPNFSGQEKLELISIIHNKYRQIIENKLTDKISMSEKESAWENIEKDFNASSKAGLFRNQDCLKRFYENRKREVRKLKAKQRQAIMKTGGGPETVINFDHADELLLEVMNIKTIEGLPNAYDSDLIIRETSTDKNIIAPKRFKKADDLNSPKDPVLRRLYSNNEETPESTMENNTIIIECDGIEYVQNSDIPLAEGRVIKPVDAATTYLCDEPSTSSIDNKPEEQLKDNSFDLSPPKKQLRKLKTKINKTKLNAPRRTGIQILASSHIAKKYDELLDQRKILLSKQIEIANQDLAFNSIKHKLEVELLTIRVAKEKREANL